jgi:hypothetical protein
MICINEVARAGKKFRKDGSQAPSRRRTPVPLMQGKESGGRRA